MLERLECVVLQTERYINTLNFYLYLLLLKLDCVRQHISFMYLIFL